MHVVITIPDLSTTPASGAPDLQRSSGGGLGFPRRVNRASTMADVVEASSRPQVERALRLFFSSFTSTRPGSDVRRPAGMRASFHQTDSLAFSLFIHNCKQTESRSRSHCTASVVAENSSHPPPLNHIAPSSRCCSWRRKNTSSTLSWRFSFSLQGGKMFSHRCSDP